MQRILQTAALLGAFLVLCFGLWQGWSFLVTFKKMVVGYLAIFILGAFALLALQAAGSDEEEGNGTTGNESKKTT